MRRPVKARDSTGAARDPNTARTFATALLARRDYASTELCERLERKGFDRSTVDSLIEELVQERVLDDCRYAANYVSYHAGRGQGPLRITADLLALGLPATVIDAALAGGPDWRASARELRVRKFGQETPSEWAEKARQARFLQYRGFSSDHIRWALGADHDLD
jgi:regulatory protein